jgi:glycosyltransferase involved in cell wall biosynthesis
VDWPGYGAQKNRALEMAQQEWVLSMDADEVLSPQLLAALHALFEAPMEKEAYAVLRRNHFGGRPVRGGVYGPAWKVRLIRKGSGRWEGEILHETLEPTGPVGRLSGFLEHTPYADEADFKATSRTYAKLFAEKAHGVGRRSHWWDLVFRPLLHFVKAYLLKAGFRDGKRGFTLARLGAREVGLKWRSLRLLSANSQNSLKRE